MILLADIRQEILLSYPFLNFLNNSVQIIFLHFRPIVNLHKKTINKNNFNQAGHFLLKKHRDTHTLKKIKKNLALRAFYWKSHIQVSPVMNWAPGFAKGRMQTQAELVSDVAKMLSKSRENNSTDQMSSTWDQLPTQPLS